MRDHTEMTRGTISDLTHHGKTALFDHPVGAGEHRSRHVERERLSRLQIDHQLEFDRRLHRQLATSRCLTPIYCLCVTLVGMWLSSSQPFDVTMTVPPMFTRWLPMQAFGSNANTMPGSSTA